MDRDEILRRLIADGVITAAEAQEIRTWSQPSDGPDVIIGYVKSFDVAPRDISTSLGINVTQVMGYQERSEPPSSQWNWLSDWFQGFVSAEDRRERRAADTERRQDWVMAQEELDLIYDDILNTLNQMVESGEISEQSYHRARQDLFAVNPNDQTFDVLDQYFDLMDAFAEDTGIPAEQAFSTTYEITADSLVQQQWVEEEERQAYEQAMQTPYQPLAWPAGMEPPGLYIPEVEAPEAEAPGALAPGLPIDPGLAAGIQSFGDMLSSLGLTVNYDAEGRVQQVELDRPFISAGVPGAAEPGNLYDPSTGNIFTLEELVSWDENQVYEYSQLAPTESVQQLIDLATGPGPNIPAEDLNIPSVIPDDPWERPLYTWQQGDALAQWRAMSGERRAYWTQAMIDHGLIPDVLMDMVTANPSDPTGSIQLALYQEALGVSYDEQVDPLGALSIMANYKEATRRLEEAQRGRTRQPFSVPASLRTIPDYPTLQQEVKDMLRRRLGRDPEDWEITLLADELQEQHKVRQTELIKVARAAYNGANVGEFVEVPDPAVRTQKFFEETYANEIGRQEDIAEATVSNRNLINAITRGAQMVGPV